ncbi:hypothetical protein BKA59DRAFT_444744 [Fusarium tricinctum]|uniref:Uncharacterized protein n=1 Tax=Fusarium tricinctum TaxID=61284 RepID=A0A8K0W6S4_9HYPO|nr:hypothetical protein BKA59DRAFT_444744 [Fusarium tricinctum]
MLYPMEKYLVAHGAMVVIGAWIPSLVLFICSLRLVRSQKDPARTGFTFFKWALFMFSGTAFFDVCSRALQTALNWLWFHNDDDESDHFGHTVQGLSISLQSIQVVFHFFDMITDILVMIMLLRLSTGILIAHSSRNNTFGKKLRLVSYGAAFILGVLTLTVLGLRIRYICEALYGDYEIAQDCALQNRQIRFTFNVLIFVVSLAVVARAAMVKRQSKADRSLSWCSTMLVVASVVWLLRTTFNMAIFAAENNLSNIYGDPKYEFANLILEVVFGIWPQFIVLCIVFAMGLAKEKGIWSRQQPLKDFERNQQPV